MRITIETPDDAQRLLRRFLNSRRPPAIFLGAGASRCDGYPLMSDLARGVHLHLSADSRNVMQYIVSAMPEAANNLETLLGVLLSTARIGSFTEVQLNAAILEIKQFIFEQFCRMPTATHHREFFRGIVVNAWWTGPIDVFTTNYDVAIEVGLERIGALYTTGFTGVFKRRWWGESLFDTVLVGPNSMGLWSQQVVPYVYFRVVKLHGSVSWRYGDNLRVYEVTDLAQLMFDRQKVPIIYPSVEKTGRFMMDTPYMFVRSYFAKALATRAMNLIVIGYSFGDEHINKIIVRSAAGNPNLVLWIFTRNSERIPDSVARDRRHVIVSSPEFYKFEVLGRLLDTLEPGSRRRNNRSARYSDEGQVNDIIGENRIRHPQNWGLRPPARARSSQRPAASDAGSADRPTIAYSRRPRRGRG